MIINLLAGTYTIDTKSQGIYQVSFHTDSGRSDVKLVVNAQNPSYIKWDPENQMLYFVQELGENNGRLSACKFQDDKNSLGNQQTELCKADHPCHVSVSNKNKLLFSSNYSSGSLSVFGMDTRGGIQVLRQVISYSGHGPNVQRQLSPHIHSAFMNKAENQVYVLDLGSDRIHVYNIDSAGNIAVFSSITCSPGGGPRHLAFSPDEKLIYVLLELTAEIAVYKTGDDPNLIQTISLNEKDFLGFNCAAAIKISEDGRYLYASNRGEANRITLFKIHPVTGLLTYQEAYRSGGLEPRDFSISPCGNYLFVANQFSNEIAVFDRNSETGSLKESRHRIQVPAPSCIEFY